MSRRQGRAQDAGPGPTIVRDSVKTVVILDTETTSTHPMEPVLERRGFAVLRAGTVEEAVGFLKTAEVAVDLVIAEVPLSGSTSQTASLPSVVHGES